MVELPEIEVLRTSIPLLAPVWLLSILAGVAYDYTHWLGYILAVPLIYAVGRAIGRINSASEVDVKVIEVVLLNALMPILATLSLLARFDYPEVVSPLNVILMAMVVPNCELVNYTYKKFNPISKIIWSSFLLFWSVLETGFTHDLGSSATLPTATVVTYALMLLWVDICELREKLPITALRMVFLVISCIGIIACYMSSFIAPHLITGLATATIVSTLLFLFFDFFWYQMRLLKAGQNNSVWKAWNHVSHKLSAIAIVGCWAALDFVLNSGDNFIAIAHMAVMPNMVRWHMNVKQRRRQPEPNMPKEEDICQKTAVRMIAITSIIILMICTAFCTYLDAYISIAPPSLLLIAMGLLYLILTHLLDEIRAILIPFNNMLFWICVGLSAFTALTAFYLCLGNESPDMIMLNATEVGSSAPSVEKLTPLQRSICLIYVLFLDLCIHFDCAFGEQEELEKKWKEAVAAGDGGDGAAAVTDDAAAAPAAIDDTMSSTKISITDSDYGSDSYDSDDDATDKVETGTVPPTIA